MSLKEGKKSALDRSENQKRVQCTNSASFPNLIPRVIMTNNNGLSIAIILQSMDRVSPLLAHWRPIGADMIIHLSAHPWTLVFFNSFNFL